MILRKQEFLFYKMTIFGSLLILNVFFWLGTYVVDCQTIQTSKYISSPSQSKHLTVSKGFNKITITNIPSDASHVVFQLHSPMKPLTISFNHAMQRSTSKTGCHVGLLTILSKMHGSTIDYFIKSEYNQNFTILGLYQAYTFSDPIPGGCNLEFNLEYDSNLLSLDNIISPDNMLDVHFALGNVFVRREQFDCSSTLLWKSTKYHLYGFPLFTSGGSVFKSSSLSSLSSDRISRIDVINEIQKISSLKNITRHGELLATYDPMSHQPPKFVLARRINTAQILVVVMESVQEDTPTYATYVFTVVYGCHGNSSISCSYIESRPLNAVTFSLLGFVGLIFVILAHKWPKTQGCLIACGLVLLIGLGIAQYISHGQSTLAGILIVCVLIMPCLLLVAFILCRCLPDEARIPLYPTAFAASYLIVAALYFSPLGELGTMKQAQTFGLVVPISILILLIVILPFKTLCIAFSTSTVGVFVFLAGLSCGVLPGSVFQYVLLDQYFRLALPEYLGAIHYSPLGLVDLILLVCWFGLTFISTLVIFLYTRWKSCEVIPGVTNSVAVSPHNQRENQPLLFDWNSRFQSYGQGSTPYGSTDNLLPVISADPLNPSIGSSIPSTTSSKLRFDSIGSRSKRNNGPLTQL